MSNEVYIGNLRDETTELAICDLFRRVGIEGIEWENVQIPIRGNGSQQGYCLVQMPDPPTVAAAISALNGTDFNGKTIKVIVAPSPSRRR